MSLFGLVEDLVFFILIDWTIIKILFWLSCKMIRDLKYDWTDGRQEVCWLEDGLDKDAVCHQFCSTCTANALQKKLWMGFETSRSEGKLFTLWNMQMTLY